MKTSPAGARTALFRPLPTFRAPPKGTTAQLGDLFADLAEELFSWPADSDEEESVDATDVRTPCLSAGSQALSTFCGMLLPLCTSVGAWIALLALSFALFSAAFCDALLEEMASFEASELPRTSAPHCPSRGPDRCRRPRRG